jgi:hypothetical protein
LSASIFANSLVSPLGISPLAVMIMGTIVTSSCLHICFISTAKSLYLSLFSLYFSWLLWSLGMAISIRKVFSLFYQSELYLVCCYLLLLLLLLIVRGN